MAFSSQIGNAMHNVPSHTTSHQSPWKKYDKTPTALDNFQGFQRKHSPALDMVCTTEYQVFCLTNSYLWWPGQVALLYICDKFLLNILENI